MSTSAMDRETPLHLAVLKEDYRAIKSLCEDLQLLHAKNALGFDAVEVARLLGKEACLEILQPYLHRRICVQRKGSRKVEKISVKEFQQLFRVAYRSHLHFDSYDLLQEVLRNCPWLMKKTFWGDDNRELGQKFQREFYNGYVEDLSIKWIDDKLGYGVFTNISLQRGDFIGEFTGNVRRLYRKHPDQNEYCFHYPTRFFSWKYFTVDALMQGNETRFINHSDHPNLDPFCALDRDLLHIAFFTNQDIKAGTQLTYNYGKDFWRHREKTGI